MKLCSKELGKFYATKGVRRHKIVMYNPQQNGLDERMNKTLLEGVRIMMLGVSMDKDLWWEALKIATYLINRSPFSGIYFMSLMHKWTRHPLDFRSLKTFKCVAYVQIKEDKLGPRELKYVFICYPKDVKDFRLWCIEEGRSKIIIVLNEHQFPFLKSRDNNINQIENRFKSFEW